MTQDDLHRYRSGPVVLGHAILGTNLAISYSALFTAYYDVDLSKIIQNNLSGSGYACSIAELSRRHDALR